MSHINHVDDESGAQASFNHEPAGNGLKDIFARARAVPGGTPYNAITSEKTHRTSSSGISIETFEPISQASELNHPYASGQDPNIHNPMFDDAVTNFQESNFHTFTESMTGYASGATGSSRTLAAYESSDWTTMQYPYRTANPVQSRHFEAYGLSSDQLTASELRNDWSGPEEFADPRSLPEADIDNVSHFYSQGYSQNTIFTLEIPQNFRNLSTWLVEILTVELPP